VRFRGTVDGREGVVAEKSYTEYLSSFQVSSIAPLTADFDEYLLVDGTRLALKHGSQDCYYYSSFCGANSDSTFVGNGMIENAVDINGFCEYGSCRPPPNYHAVLNDPVWGQLESGSENTKGLLKFPSAYATREWLGLGARVFVRANIQSSSPLWAPRLRLSMRLASQCYAGGYLGQLFWASIPIVSGDNEVPLRGLITDSSGVPAPEGTGFCVPAAENSVLVVEIDPAPCTWPGCGGACNADVTVQIQQLNVIP